MSRAIIIDDNMIRDGGIFPTTALEQTVTGFILSNIYKKEPV